MHPILANRTRLAAYLVAWGGVGALLAVKLTSSHVPWSASLMIGLVSAYVAGLAFLSSYYLCRAMPLQGGRRIPVLVITWVIATLVMGFLWALGTNFLVVQIGRFYTPLHGIRLQLIGSATTGSTLYLLTVALHYLMIALERAREVERVGHEQRVLAREAELKALRAQLNPHFLFNSLNSISALTSIDGKRARQMCVLLSDFLRRSLKLGERETVSLAEELELLRNYLAIEEIRFGERLKVELESDPAVENAQVPPLILQPLVENAIKHGISQIPEGGTITIRALKFDDFVEVCVENPVDDDAARPEGLGLGLHQVKQRLQGRFDARTRFEATLQDGRYRVLLIFPLEWESPKGGSCE